MTPVPNDVQAEPNHHKTRFKCRITALHRNAWQVTKCLFIMQCMSGHFTQNKKLHACGGWNHRLHRKNPCRRRKHPADTLKSNQDPFRRSHGKGQTDKDNQKGSTMKTILLTAGSIVAISIATFTATTAVADHGHGMGQGKGPLANISIPVENAGGIAACLFDRMDRDDDGLIDARASRTERDDDAAQAVTLQDMQNKAAARFARMDRNGDGQLDDADKAIVMAEHAQCASLIGLDLAAIEDDRRDGAGRGKGRRGGMNPDAAVSVVLKQLDKNNLAGLDIDGLAGTIQTQLQDLDSDADGVVRADEIMAIMGERKGRGNGSHR